MARASSASWYARYVCDPLQYAGAGYFCSYIVGLLLSLLSRVEFLSMLGKVADYLGGNSLLVGAVIGASVALAFDISPISILSGTVAGAIGFSFGGLFSGILASYGCALLCSFLAGRTRADLFVVPLLCTTGGVLAALLLTNPVNMLCARCGNVLLLTEKLPMIWMYTAAAAGAALISVTPLSMFAVVEALSGGMLSGACFVGCCAGMVSLGVAAYHDNGIWAALAHGLGTARLQMGNVWRHPGILIAPLVSAALAGMLASFFRITCGTGCIPQALTLGSGVFAFLAETPQADWLLVLGKFLLCAVIVPIALTIPLAKGFRAAGLLPEGAMRVDV